LRSKGAAGFGRARHGWAGHGKDFDSPCGEAWQVSARRGAAGRGKVRHGKARFSKQPTCGEVGRG